MRGAAGPRSGVRRRVGARDQRAGAREEVPVARRGHVFLARPACCSRTGPAQTLRSSRLIIQRLSMLIAPPNSPVPASDCPRQPRTSPTRLAAKHTLLTHVHFAVRPHARLPFIVIPMDCRAPIPQILRLR